MFNTNELYDLDDALKNHIDDLNDYCAQEEGVDERVKRLEALRAKVTALTAVGEPNRHTRIPEIDGLFYYFAQGAAEPEPVLINMAKYGVKLKGFNGRLQSWLRDGEYLVGPMPAPEAR